MAGVYERLTSGKKDAVAQGGGVSFVPEDKGVYAKIARENQGVHSRITQEKPSDPIYDQWKLEQQMREEMERVRQERLQQQKEAAVKAGAPAMAMQPVVTAAQVAVEQAGRNIGAEPTEEKPVKELRADRKTAIKTAREELRQARAEAGKTYATAEDHVAALPVYKKALADANAAFDAAKTAAWEPANRQAAPERYDNAVTLKGTDLQESYNAEAMAKGAKAAGNPLVDFEGYVEDRRKATGQSPAAMFGVARGADGKGARAADFLSTLSGKEREYIDYLYGTYDRQKAAQLLQAYLTNRANEQPALRPQVVDALQQAENAVQQADKKTMGRNAGKVPVYIQSHLQDAQRGANINNNAGGVVAGMLSKPAYAVETVAQSVRNLAKGTDLTAPLYSEAALGVADSKAAEKRFLDNFENKKLQWVAGVGLSIANSAANRLLGPIGKFMMGLQAMGGDAYDLAQEGEDATTILMHSALAGIAEGVAEGISWGRLDEILNGMPPKTFRGLLKTVRAQMATEFGEEAVTEGVNILTDWATRGENSTIAEVAAQAKEDGREHPGWYTAGVMAGQIALAGLAGAFSGGIMGGSALALNAMRNQIGGNAAKANGQAVDLAQKAENAAGNDAAQVEAEGLQSAAEPVKQGAEEVPKAAAGIRVEAPIMAVGDEKDAARMNAFIPGSAVVRGEENAQETVADFAQTAADQMPAAENTQNLEGAQEKEQRAAFRGRVDDSEIRGIKLTERQKADKKVYEALSSALGVQIRLTSSKADEMGRRSGDNGYYDRRTNSFVFDINAENFSELDRDAKGQLNTAAALTMSHELTHYIQRWSPEQYGALKDTVMRILQEQTGQDVATIIDRKRQTLMQDGQPRMDDTAVLDEIVADGCQMMLRDSGVFEQIAQKNRTLGQKIVDWLKSAVTALRKAYEGLTARSSEAKYIAQVAENYQRVLDQWTAALMDARDTSRNGPQTSAESVIEKTVSVTNEAQDAIEEQGSVSGKAEQKRYVKVTKEQAERWKNERIADHELKKRGAVAKAAKNSSLTMPEMVAEVDEALNKDRKRTEAQIMEDRRAIAKELETFREFMREGGTAEEYLQNGAPEMREMRPKGWAERKAIDAQEDSMEALEREYQKSVMEEIGVQIDSKTESAAPEYLSLSRRQPWQVDLKTGEWEATTDVPGRQAPYQKPRQTEQILKMLEELTRHSDEEKITDLQSTAGQVKQPEAENIANVQQTKTKPEELPKAEKPENQSSTSQVKPQGTGWEKFEDNRIAQAMHHKPEGAVANMGDAERVRHAEEEIRKARKTLQELEEDAQDGEVRTAEGIAKGEMTLKDVSPRFSVEKVARMAEQMRLIKQWEEQGITGQRKGLHETQFKVAEELMEGADDSIFEHDPKGAKGIVGKRRMEFGKLLASTSERVMHRVFDGKTAQKAIEEYIRPAERNEAAKIMAIGRLFDGARELKLNRYESTMVQLVGEGLMPEWNGAGTNPLWKNGQKMVESLPEYARENPEIKKLAENLSRIEPEKITKAVEWYRKTYKDFHAMVNNFRLAHGMPEIGSIENYFPHFSQDMDGDMLNRTLKSFGIEQMGDLPASIAGRTAGFRPVSRWVGSFQKRTGPQTVFDAEQGFQMYANAVMDMLYHTDDIMRIRHLEWVIRQRSREQEKTGKRPGIEERLKQTKQMLEDPVQLARIEEIMEEGEKDATGKDLSAEYSGFVQWLQEYGNKLANKGDTYRFMERILGRRTANMMNKMLGNYGAAQIVGNVRSALANTAVLPKMVSLLSTKSGKAAGKAEIYIGQALWKMARGEMRDVYGRSEFMSSKKGVDPLVRTAKDRHSNAHMILFNVVEDAMSKLSFTAGYVQAQDELKKSGKSGAEIEREVIQRANDFAAQVMSRRDKAGASLLSRSREPIVRLAGMFQTEIANEWQTFTQDMPREAKVLADKLGKKKAAAVYGAALARYLVYSNVLAYAAETVLGVNPFNDWLTWIADLVRDVWEEPEEEGEKGKINFEAVKDFAGEAAGTVPYISGIAAMLGYTNDRVPVGNVLELIENAGSIVSAQRPSGKIEGAINAANVAGQLVGFPGAGQYAKSLKGIVAMADGGKRSQKTGQLQDVWQPKEEESWKDAARAIAFGPSAMEGVREYYDTGKAELTKKQTEAYDAKVKAGVPKGEALEYAKDIMPALTSSQLEAYDAAIGAGIHKDTALSYVKWSKGVTAKKDIPNSKRIQYLQQANEFESLTGEQRAILYQGALPSDQAKEFEEMTQKVDRLGVDMNTWLEFLERYYQIRGSGKKQRVRELMEKLELPPTTAQILGDIIGYDIR